MQKVLSAQLLITALFLQGCDLLATVHVLQLGFGEGNPLYGSQPDVMRLVGFKLAVVVPIVWLTTTEKGCRAVVFINIVYGLVVLYSLAGMTMGS